MNDYELAIQLKHRVLKVIIEFLDENKNLKDHEKATAISFMFSVLISLFARGVKENKNKGYSPDDFIERIFKGAKIHLKEFSELKETIN